LKSAIAILLASVFLFHSASKLLIIANYEINKEYISKNLCENKAKPKLKCNGKCHLVKELKKQDKKENTPANSLKEKLEIQFFSIAAKNKIKTQTPAKEKAETPYLFSNYSNSLNSIFHPPRV